MALTITAAFIALSVGGWTISSESSLHAKFGLTIFIMGITLMFGGITALIVRVKVNMAWNTKTVLRIGMVHRWYGWGLVIVSQATIGTGAYNFYSFDGKDSVGWGIAGGSAALFFTLLLVGEIRHQIRLRKEIEFVRPETTMTSAEFEQAVAEGRKLVILDELVLDVERFTSQHPGGRFVLQHNNGRDISKFFYGGYSLEGNIGATKPAQGYAHSPLARMIVNDLAIAHYEPNKTVSTTICRVRKDLSVTVNPRTDVVTLENIDQDQKVPNFKAHFKNIAFLTKHFLVRSRDSDNVARHYTICNAMRPDVYKMYLKALKPEDDP